jgi:hypothetical protein
MLPNSNKIKANSFCNNNVYSISLCEFIITDTRHYQCFTDYSPCIFIVFNMEHISAYGSNINLNHYTLFVAHRQ